MDEAEIEVELAIEREIEEEQNLARQSRNNIRPVSSSERDIHEAGRHTESRGFLPPPFADEEEECGFFLPATEREPREGLRLSESNITAELCQHETQSSTQSSSRGAHGASAGTGKISAHNKHDQSMEKDSVGGFAGNKSCEKCGSLTVYGSLIPLGAFVCAECKKGDASYDLMTKARAKDEFLLPDRVINGLPFIEKSNPRHNNWIPMKLYLRRSVERAAFDRYDGPEGLDKEKMKRSKIKYKKASKRTQSVFKKSSAKSILENAKRRRGSRTSNTHLTDIDAYELSPPGSATTKRTANLELAYKGAHKHVWEEAFDASSNVWRKSCKECRHSVVFDKI